MKLDYMRIKIMSMKENIYELAIQQLSIKTSWLDCGTRFIYSQSKSTE